MLKKYSLILVLFFLAACNPKQEQGGPLESDVPVLSSELPEGFHDFYDKFHSDSIFQLDHIVFPLKGEVTRKDSMETLTVEKVYDRATWKLHRPFRSDSGFSRGFTVMGDLVMEEMSDQMALYTIQRRWGKVDSTWSLIYYGTQERSW